MDEKKRIELEQQILDKKQRLIEDKAKKQALINAPRQSASPDTKKRVQTEGDAASSSSSYENLRAKLFEQCGSERQARLSGRKYKLEFEEKWESIDRLHSSAK